MKIEDRFNSEGLIFKDLINSLTKSLRDGRLICFAGAGLARSQGYPSWHKLITSLLSEYQHQRGDAHSQYFSRCLEKKSYAEIAEVIKRNDEELYVNFIHREFSPERIEQAGPSELYKTLVKVPFHSYVTTNYDLSLEKALERSERPIHQKMVNSRFDWKDVRKTQETIKYDYRHIFHAHGMWKESKHDTADSVILSESDYQSIRRIPLYKEYLKNVFEKYSFLFLGFGMQDWEVEWIDNFISENLSHNTDICVLTDDLPPDIVRHKNTSSDNLSWVSYNSNYERNKPNHEAEIIEFLEHISPKGIKEKYIRYPSEISRIELTDHDDSVRLEQHKNNEDETKIDKFRTAVSRAGANDKVFIFDTYAEYIADLEHDLRKALSKGVDIQILFLERNSYFSLDRSKTLGFSPNYVDNMLLHCETVIKRLAKEQVKLVSNKRNNPNLATPGTIEYKTFNQSPPFSLLCVSNTDEGEGNNPNSSNHYFTIFGLFYPAKMSIYTPYYIAEGDQHTMFFLDAFHTIWFGSAKKVQLTPPKVKSLSLKQAVKYFGTVDELSFSEEKLDDMLKDFLPTDAELDHAIEFLKNNKAKTERKPYLKNCAYEIFNVTRKQFDLDIFVLYWPKANKANPHHYHFDTKGYMYLARGKTEHVVFSSQEEAQNTKPSKYKDMKFKPEVIHPGKITKLRKGLYHCKKSLEDETLSIHFYYPALKKQKFLDDSRQWRYGSGVDKDFGVGDPN